MKVNETKSIRNLVVVSHGNAGKTTLSEAILFKRKIVGRIGKVEDGNTVSDYQPEEKERKFSISLSIIPFEYNGVKVNYIDTPGYSDFVGEVLSGIRGGDNGLMLINAAGGIEIQTKKYWKFLENGHKPRAFFVNKLDLEGTDFLKIVEQVRQTFGMKVIPVTVPIYENGKLSSVFSLFDGKDQGLNDSETVEEFKKQLREIAAEGDDSLLEKYLEGGELSPEDIKVGLRNAFIRENFFPLFAGSALSLIGIDEFLNFIVDFMASPEDIVNIEGTNPKNNELEKRKISTDETFSAFVFKTLSDPYVGKLSFTKIYSGILKSNSQVYNSSKDALEKLSQLLFLTGSAQEAVDEVIAGDICVITKLTVTQTNDTLSDRDNSILYPVIKFPEPMLVKSMRPKTKNDEDRMSIGLARVIEEDPTLKVSKNLETKEQLISGIGEIHLSVVTEKLSQRYGVNIDLAVPKVPYRETITTKIKVEGKYKKQTGGHGQYGHCLLEVEPIERGKALNFESKIFGGSIPKQYIPAIEKGVKEAMGSGMLAGFSVADIGVAVVDGSYHPVDSSEMAFKIAGSMALKKALEQGNSILLEPIENITVLVDEQYMGDVIGDLNSKRGKVLGMKIENNKQIIEALVPLAEILNYANDLNSITQGTGEFTMEFSHYEQVPPKIADKIIQESQLKKGKEE
ncbi:MAG: elongation factor G [Caldiserica bacterium CG02_land_8_20_14_3_00_36_38]|nr:MAG: elongation factor G [Caldiserica bacterium CG02_land_8_20_14_3_00_36_38]PIX28787.1 MAG: elongation factor G [Caldiserica bacterium CG_4_8_14_3_um_filter_35_18]